MPDAELALLTAADSSTEYRVLDRDLRAVGWTTAGVGDWATVLASPSRQWAARISSFDPAAPYTALLYEVAASTRWVPQLVLHRELAGGSQLTVMEHLDAAPEADAVALHRAIAARAPEVEELVDRLHEVHARARAELPWCGPVDDNPDNVMRTADGRLVVTDPFYADGPELYRVAEHDPDALVRAIPPERRRHLTEIPVAASGPWPEDERERMRRGLAEADARASTD